MSVLTLQLFLYCLFLVKKKETLKHPLVVKSALVVVPLRFRAVLLAKWKPFTL